MTQTSRECEHKSRMMEAYFLLGMMFRVSSFEFRSKAQSHFEKRKSVRP